MKAFQTGVRFFILAGAVILFAGCATVPPRSTGWRYLQRPSTRVAIMPAVNRTTAVDAPIILGKAWEEDLRVAGFGVVGTDSVVTYASSRGIALVSLATVPSVRLGAELKADYILDNEITSWGEKYRVLSDATVVAGRSSLIEASTGAVVWESRWAVSNANNNNNGGLIGALVGAAVQAAMDKMLNAAPGLAKQGVAMNSRTLPYPGLDGLESATH